MTNTSQPLFHTTYAGALDVTGDGTTFTLGSGGATVTEITDQGAVFSTSTFTAPVTGTYLITSVIAITGMTSSHNRCEITLVTSNRNYVGAWHAYNVAAAAGDERISFSSIADFDASDTCTFTVRVDSGAKVVDIIGSRCYFSGFLIC